MMGFSFFSWVWNVLVTFVMCVPCSFVLEVLFMIICEHILMSCWLRVCQLAWSISQVIIYHFSLLIFIDVHVCNRGNLLFHNLCSRCPSPVSFNSLHMPLINNSHNFVTIHIVQIPENSFVSLVDQNGFLLWSHFVQHLNHQINPASINGFSKGFTSSSMQNIKKVFVIRLPSDWVPLEESGSPKSSMEVHISFLP